MDVPCLPTSQSEKQDASSPRPLTSNEEKESDIMDDFKVSCSQEELNEATDETAHTNVENAGENDEGCCDEPQNAEALLSQIIEGICDDTKCKDNCENQQDECDKGPDSEQVSLPAIYQLEKKQDCSSPVLHPGEDYVPESDEEDEVMEVSSGEDYVPESSSSDDDDDDDDECSEAMEVSCPTVRESGKHKDTDSGKGSVSESSSDDHDKRSEVHGDQQKSTRNYSKRQACLYCKELVSKAARHLKAMHSEETEVKNAKAKESSVERKRSHDFEILRLKGNFYHNMEVLATTEGSIIPVRNPVSGLECDMSDYLPCPSCLGFYLQRDLWRHKKTCFCRKRDSSPSNEPFHKFKQDSLAIMQPFLASEQSQDALTKHVLQSMMHDDISMVVRRDGLILELGKSLLLKVGSAKHEYIAQRLRQLGRLVLTLRKLGDGDYLTDFLKPERFDMVVEGVRQISMMTSGTGDTTCGVPSLSLKLGYSLKKCVLILQGLALRQRDPHQLELAKMYLQLHESEWSDKISSHALNTMASRKFNKGDILPVTSDLVKLRTFLLAEMDGRCQALSQAPSPQTWMPLVEAVLSRLILFNKRRGGEAARMLVKSYEDRPVWQQFANQEITQSLSSLEQKISSRLDLVEIRGKRGRRVPVLLTRDMKAAIDVLLKHREAAGIHQYNPFLFARPRNSLQPVRGWDCLNSVAKEADLQHPNLVTSTKLRKYVATVSQVIDLSGGEMDWLARHLGHDINVHREFYRKQDSTIELAKVSKLLLAVDCGKVAHLAGRKLDDIQLDDLEMPGSDQGEDSEDDQLEPQGKIPRMHVDAEQSARSSKEPNHQNQSKKRKGAAARRPWSKAEKKALYLSLGSFIRSNKVPGKGACEKAKAEHPVALQDRDWRGIKYWVKNTLVSVNRNIARE